MPLKMINRQDVTDYHGSTSKLVNISDDLTVGEVMTKNIQSISKDKNLMEAWQLMLKTSIRHLPVTDSEGFIQGVISDRDLGGIGAQIEDFPVSQVMTHSLISATDNTKITDVAAVMFEKKIGSIPIIDEKRTLIGIITRSDLLKLFFEIK